MVIWGDGAKITRIPYSSRRSLTTSSCVADFRTPCREGSTYWTFRRAIKDAAAILARTPICFADGKRSTWVSAVRPKLDDAALKQADRERVRVAIRTFIAERCVGETVEFRTPVLVAIGYRI